MRTDELTEAMHAAAVVSAPDLDRITRRGRRIAARRRIGTGVAALTVAALAAAPFSLLDGGPAPDVAQVQDAPTEFLPGSPVGGVLETESKFYQGHEHSSSLGPEAVWAEAGSAPGAITFGFRREGTTQVLRAGEMDVPDVGVEAVDLPPMPGQHDEPTYVGLVRLPEGASADRFAVAVERQADGHTVHVLQDGTVLPGYLVFTVSATTELDGAAYIVTNRRGRTVAEGGFAPVRD